MRLFSCISLATQILFHLLQQGLQPPSADAQCHARGQDVDDGEMEQARNHGAVAVETFGVVGTEVDVAHLGQG